MTRIPAKIVKTASACSVLVLASRIACGQSEALTPEFEVASVKSVREGSPGGYYHELTPGGLTMRGVSMGYCIRLAYGLSAQRPWELIGPAWIDPPTDDLFDIAGKTSTPESGERIRLMLQNLLRARFSLVVHREKRPLSCYALVVARTPLPAFLRDSSSHASMKIRQGEKPYQLVFEHVSMHELAQQLGPPMTTRPVVDRTEIEGSFDFTLDIGRYILDPATGNPIFDSRGAIDSEGATLRAVRDQLGLMLKPARDEFDVLVIDRLEKRPSGN